MNHANLEARGKIHQVMGESVGQSLILPGAPPFACLTFDGFTAVWQVKTKNANLHSMRCDLKLKVRTVML